MDTVFDFFYDAGFMPHGFCLLWDPTLVLSHVVSDATIAIAYFSLPVFLIVLLRKRPELRHGWLITLFALFIMLCGVSHLFNIWTLWIPDYRTQGFIKVITALASIGTAIAAWPLLPKLLAIPSTRQLEDANGALREEVAHRRRVESSLQEKAAEMAGYTEELKRTEQEYRDLADGSLQGLVILKGDSVCYTNQAFAKMTGYDNPQELINCDLFDTIASPDRRDTSREMVHNCARNPELQDPVTLDCRTRTGTPAWMHCQARHIEWMGEPALQVTFVDITRQRVAEKAIRRSDRLESLGQLTGGIAHDFNNLLGIFTGSADLVDRRSKGDPRIAKYTANIRDAANRGQALTGKLLNFANNEPAGSGVTDLNALIGETTETLRGTLPATLHIEPVLEQGLWRVRANAKDVRDAITELTNNACEAMEGAGVVRIVTRNISVADRSQATLNGCAAGDYVMVQIVDTGCGMTEDVRAQAFDPFFTTKERGKATGLGLSTVYGFVERSAGFMEIDTEPGAGSSVSLYLPRAAESSGSADISDDEQDDAGPGIAGQESVLVIDDEAALKEIAQNALTDFGYRVTTAKDANAAQAILAKGETFDLIFSDVVMPGGMNGTELARLIRNDRPDQKILLTSGYTNLSKASDKECPLLAKILRKPYTIDELAVRVRETLDA